MYYKRSTGPILLRKSVDTPAWVKWTHHSQGPSCCPECLALDGCWFPLEKAPAWPHHPNCHCTLDPLDYADVMARAVSRSDYGKFDPYLFNTQGRHPHGKEVLFGQWGYTADDAPWLQAELEKQAREQYLLGHFDLDDLDKRGQRINIRITITRRDTGAPVSFLTGWMVYPDGQIRLVTPYGGK